MDLLSLSASITLTILSSQSKQILLINFPMQPAFAGFSNLPTCLTESNALLKASIWHTNYNAILRTVSEMVWLNFLSMILVFFETWKNNVLIVILACTVLLMPTQQHSWCACEILKNVFALPEPGAIPMWVAIYPSARFPWSYNHQMLHQMRIVWWQKNMSVSLYKYNVICYLSLCPILTTQWYWICWNC